MISYFCNKLKCPFMQDLTSANDLELFSFLQEGNHQAYSEIYNRYQGLLYIYACKIVRNADEAEEIVQEIFFYLWDKRTTINLTTSVSSYLYCAVRYKFFNLLDHKQVRVNYEKSFRDFIDSGEAITDNYIREKELSKLIEQQISLLPLKMRQVFELSRKGNLSNKEIAVKLKISIKTVKNQVNNSLKELRLKLGLFTYLVIIFSDL